MLTIQALQDLGVNTREGLSRMMNDENFYFRMIRKGMANIKIEPLKTALEANDLDEAFKIAHDLKGMTGNLSLTPIYEPISELTELLRTKAQIDYTPYLEIITEKTKAVAALCSDD